MQTSGNIEWKPQHATELLCLATVLIVDSDCGFVFWIGEIFAKAGCSAVPALDCQQAVSLTTKLNLKVDMVVVNPVLAGVSEMIRSLQSPNRLLKIVAIQDRHVQAICAIPAHAILRKPSGWESISYEEWVDRVRKILRGVQVTGVV